MQEHQTRFLYIIIFFSIYSIWRDFGEVFPLADSDWLLTIPSYWALISIQSIAL